jgi:MFS transporter, DHA1 family, multidrug resistance protein
MTIKQNSSKEIKLFTTCAMVLTALGIDIMLPTFGQIRQHFGLDPLSSKADNIVTFFFMGQVTQLLFGHLTDKLGRLPIIRFGAILYIISGFATVLAPTIGLMFVFRFISGMGAAAVLMTSIASVRDRFAGDEMARVMSQVFSIFLLTPVLAPALGAWILQHFSWQLVFIIPPSFAIVVLLWSFRIVESLPKEARSKAGFNEILPQVMIVLRNKHFMKYVSIATLIFSILSCYVSSSERIIGEIFKSSALFPIIFGSIGLLMACFSLINSFFTKKWGARKTLRVVLKAYCITANFMFFFIMLWGDPPPLLLFFIPLALLMALTTAGDPNSSAMSLEFMGEKAGLAASVYGTIFFFIGSSLGATISSFMNNQVIPLAISAFIFSLIALCLEYLVKTTNE